MRGRSEGIEATMTQRFSSTIAHSAAGVSLTARKLSQLRLLPNMCAIRFISHVGSKPGFLCARTSCHNLTAETTVTLTMLLVSSCVFQLGFTYTRPKRNVLLMEILCETDRWMVEMKYTGMSRTTRSKTMVKASFEVKNSGYWMQRLLMVASQKP